MITLRQYQQQIVSKVRDSFKSNKRVVLCAPTGAGKTFVFTYMVSQAIDKGKSVLVLTHRVELLTQAGGSFSKFNLTPELIDANSKPDLDKKLHIAMVETLNLRLKNELSYQQFVNQKDLIIIDEAHLQDFNKIMPYISDQTYVIGATATPLRKGKKQKSLDDFYADIVQEIDVPELIEMGYLATPRTFGIDIDMSNAKKKGDDWDMTSTYEKNKVYEGVVDNYARLTNGKKTIVFSSSIKSSKRLRDEFEMHGYPVKHIDAKSKDREEILEWFKNTPDAILCNCGILTAGFDEPTIEVVILYRSTSSLPLYLQMCGRGSRVTETKNEFYILDFGNNVRRFGFWQDKRKWSIQKEEKKINKDGVMAVRNCPSCGAMLPATIKVCSECGYKFSLKDAKDEDDKVRLIELLYSTGEVKQISQCTPMELYLLMLKKTLKAHYIYRVARSQGNDFLEQFTEVAGYSEGWLYRQKYEPKGFYDKKVRI